MHSLPNPVYGVSFDDIQCARDFDCLYPDANQVANEIYSMHNPADMRHAYLISCDALDDYTNCKEECPDRLVWEYAEWRGVIALSSAYAWANGEPENED